MSLGSCKVRSNEKSIWNHAMLLRMTFSSHLSPEGKPQKATGSKFLYLLQHIITSLKTLNIAILSLVLFSSKIMLLLSFTQWYHTRSCNQRDAAAPPPHRHCPAQSYSVGWHWAPARDPPDLQWLCASNLAELMQPVTSKQAHRDPAFSSWDFQTCCHSAILDGHSGTLWVHAKLALFCTPTLPPSTI